jgi:hypothetical protein
MLGHRAIAALLFVTAALTAPACADDTEEYLTYTELNCNPGSEIACACPGDNGRGVAVCRSDGSGYGACERCTGPGTCTVFPNCTGCFSCLERCLCQSSEDDPGACEDLCGAQEGTGGSGGTGGGSCEVASCPQPRLPLAQTCCTTDKNCGFVFQLLGPDCVEGNQAGVTDPSCPQVQLPGIPLALPGCCRDDGRCGAMDSFIGFGCVDPSQFGQPRGQRCGG